MDNPVQLCAQWHLHMQSQLQRSRVVTNELCVDHGYRHFCCRTFSYFPHWNAILQCVQCDNIPARTSRRVFPVPMSVMVSTTAAIGRMNFLVQEVNRTWKKIASEFTSSSLVFQAKILHQTIWTASSSLWGEFEQSALLVYFSAHPLNHIYNALIYNLYVKSLFIICINQELGRLGGAGG
jgi:hypothetical protein